MKSCVTVLVIFLMSCCHATWAKDIQIDPVNFGLITQKNFDDFVLDLGTAISFTPMTPAKTMGVLGGDISGELVVSDLSKSESWKYLVEDNDTFSYMPIPRLHAQKGLPFSIDVGAMLVAFPDSNVKVWGLEVKKGIIDEGGLLPIPAVSARASYSVLEGVDDIDLETISLDLLISKDILMFTPYAGLSYLSIKGSEQNPSLTGIKDVERSNARPLVGCQVLPFPFCSMNLELVFGDVPQYGFKAGIRF